MRRSRTTACLTWACAAMFGAQAVPAPIGVQALPVTIFFAEKSRLHSL